MRITILMKIVKLQKRIKKIIEKLNPQENYANHGNIRVPKKNNEKHKNIHVEQHVRITSALIIETNKLIICTVAIKQCKKTDSTIYIIMFYK